MHRLVRLSVCIYIMSGRYSTIWDQKGWPGSEIQMYYGCPWNRQFMNLAQVTLHLKKIHLRLWEKGLSLFFDLKIYFFQLPFPVKVGFPIARTNFCFRCAIFLREKIALCTIILKLHFAQNCAISLLGIVSKASATSLTLCFASLALCFLLVLSA